MINEYITVGRQIEVNVALKQGASKPLIAAQQLKAAKSNDFIGRRQ